MPSRFTPILAFLALAGALAAEAAFFLPRLPSRIATHFDAAGLPNGWNGPEALTRDTALMIATFAALFLAAGLIDHVPLSALKLPGGPRERDAAKEQAAKAYVRDWVRWSIVLTLALVAFVVGRALAANLQPAPRLGNEVFLALGAYLVATGAMLLALIRRLR